MKHPVTRMLEGGRMNGKGNFLLFGHWINKRNLNTKGNKEHILKDMANDEE